MDFREPVTSDFRDPVMTDGPTQNEEVVLMNLKLI